MLVHADKEGFVLDVHREGSEKTAICKGPSHRRGGKGTPLPLSSFGINKYNGQRTKTCKNCLVQSGRRTITETAQPTVVIQKLNVNDGQLSVKDIEHGMGSGIHKWRVVIFRPVEVVVYAKDFLDAGAEAGEGDIIRIERLD